MTGPRLVRRDSPAEAASTAGALVAEALEEVVATAGRASLAVSGGSSPGPMFAALAGAPVAWEHVELFQVDERLAPDGDPARNLVSLRDGLGPEVLDRVGLHPVRVHLGVAAAADYERTLVDRLGPDPVLDVVHLGLGDDGHTASLFPADPALGVVDHEVAVTETHRGHRRVTLTFPVLNRAGLLVWLVTGADKSVALARLLASDPSIPAGRVRHRRAVVVADRAACGQ